MAQNELLAPLLSSKASRMHLAQSLFEQVPPSPLQVKTTSSSSSKHETQIDIAVAHGTGDALQAMVNVFMRLGAADLPKEDRELAQCEIFATVKISRHRDTNRISVLMYRMVRQRTMFPKCRATHLGVPYVDRKHKDIVRFLGTDMAQ